MNTNTNTNTSRDELDTAYKAARGKLDTVLAKLEAARVKLDEQISVSCAARQEAYSAYVSAALELDEAYKTDCEKLARVAKY